MGGSDIGGDLVPCAGAAASRSDTAAASSAGMNGFVMYEVAPACMTASRLVLSPRVVSTSTGTVR